MSAPEMHPAAPPEGVPDDVVELPLRPPSLWSSGLTVLAIIAACVLGAAAAGLVPRLLEGDAVRAELQQALAVAGFWGACIGLLWARRVALRVWLRRRGGPRLVFGARAVSVPWGAEGWRQREVPYAAIAAVHQGGRAGAQHTVIEADNAVLHLPARLFAEPSGPLQLAVELRRRIMALPQGTALLERTAAERLPLGQALATRPLATQALLGSLAVMFLNTYLKGALDTPFGLVRWGANVPSLVRAGELYRLVAASFLHVSVAHAVMNAWALQYLGPTIEHFFGWPRFVLIYGVASLAAQAASALGPDTVLSVGASGGVFGLFGAFAWTSLRLRPLLPLPLRQPLRWWAAVVAINVTLALSVAGIDVAAHAAGTAAGVVAAALCIGHRPRRPPPAGPWLQGAAWGLITAALFALGVAVHHAATAAAPAADAARVAQAVLNDRHASPAALVAFARECAADTGCDGEALSLAAHACDRALLAQPDAPEMLDVASRVAARRGQPEQALRAARRAAVRSGYEPGMALHVVGLLEPATAGDPLAPAQAGDSPEPATAGDRSEPTAAGDPLTPARAGGRSEPTAAGDRSESATAGDSPAPARAGDNPDPARAGDQSEPARAGDPLAPATAGDPLAPARAGDPLAPATAGDPLAPATAGDPLAPARASALPPATWILDSSTGTATLTRVTAAPGTTEVLAVISRGNSALGLIAVQLGPQAPLPASTTSPLLQVMAPRGSSARGEPLRLKTVLVAPLLGATQPAGAVSWNVVPLPPAL